MTENITASEAVALLAEQPVRLQSRTIPLSQAWRRILSKDITARHSLPPFARSPFDGYALRSADTLEAAKTHPVCLAVTEEIAAGQMPSQTLRPFTAAKILTGAPVPPGADCVVKYEHTEFTKESVTLYRPLPPGNIIPIGEDITAGALTAAKGTVIDSGVMGMLAGQGYADVPVWHRPRIAILSTGSELVEPGRPLPPGKIYSTNLYTLSGILQSIGAVPVDGGTFQDSPEEIAAGLLQLQGNADMVLMTGGASVGDYDFALEALGRAGAEVLFRRARFKPGGAMLAGRLGEMTVLCLSGNPGAAAVGLLRVGAPYIRKLCGRARIFDEQIQAALAKPLEKASPQMRFLRGRLLVENGQAVFEESGVQNNSGVAALSGCNLLAEIPAGSPPLPAGTLVRAYRVLE